MTNLQPLLAAWKDLKQRLLKTLQELKVNHKDKWAVVKSKSASQQVKFLSPHPQFQNLKDCMREIKLIDDRPPQQMLSSTDQARYDLLKERLKYAEKLNQLRDLVRTGEYEKIRCLVDSDEFNH